MDKSVLVEMEHNQKRLGYYLRLKEKAGTEPSLTVAKWIEIYADRLKRLESKAKKMGLPIQARV